MRIGNVEITGKAALAPMAGVTDFSFREMCSSLGADMVVSEMISDKALCFDNEKTNIKIIKY